MCPRCGRSSGDLQWLANDDANHAVFPNSQGMHIQVLLSHRPLIKGVQAALDHGASFDLGHNTRQIIHLESISCNIHYPGLSSCSVCCRERVRCLVYRGNLRCHLPVPSGARCLGQDTSGRNRSFTLYLIRPVPSGVRAIKRDHRCRHLVSSDLHDSKVATTS